MRTEFILTSFLACAAVAHGAPVDYCGFGTCQIVGHSESTGAKGHTFFASCERQMESAQIEYVEGSAAVKLVDATSREEVAKCPIDPKQFAGLIESYRKKNEAIENPKCYLTQWKGQMMFVADGVKGRCSFNMGKRLSGEFKTKTGLTPLYQCEKDYFLIAGEKSATSVYRKTKGGWELACKAAIRVGEPVEAIDWKNPPQYWTPDPS